MLSTLPTCPPKRLLVLEDETALLAYLSALLNRDYEVLTAANARDAEALLEGSEVSVILCDHGLPGEQGLDFLRRMRRVYPRTQAILLTGHAEAETFSWAVAEGLVLAVLIKPSSLTEIRAAVDGALEAHARCTKTSLLDPKERPWQEDIACAPEPGSADGRRWRRFIHRFRRPWIRKATRVALLCLLAAAVFAMVYVVKRAIVTDFFDMTLLGEDIPLWDQ